jgi:hypothetical protein
MIRRRKALQVLDAVIEGVTIPMMDMMASRYRAMSLFPNVTVEVDLSPSRVTLEVPAI